MMKIRYCLIAALALCSSALAQQYETAAPRVQSAHDPYQWHVVSVQPVRRDAQGRIVYPPELAETNAADSAPQVLPMASVSRVVYTTEPVPTYTVRQEPVYVRQEPVYVQPAPVTYADPYWPLLPVAIGLSIGLGHYWHHGHHRRGWHGSVHGGWHGRHHRR